MFQKLVFRIINIFIFIPVKVPSLEKSSIAETVQTLALSYVVTEPENSKKDGTSCPKRGLDFF